MATDLTDLEASKTQRIVGSDESYAVDIIREDNVNKMLVKATTIPQTVQELIFAKFTDAGGSADMTIRGNQTPTIFSIEAHPTKDSILREIKAAAFDSGIKVDTFLGLNTAITGIQISLIINNIVQDFLPIQTTQDFDSHFAYGDGARFELISASGNDSLVAQFSPREPIVLKAGTTDRVEILIQDDLRSVAFLEFLAFGLFDT